MLIGEIAFYDIKEKKVTKRISNENLNGNIYPIFFKGCLKFIVVEVDLDTEKFLRIVDK